MICKGNVEDEEEWRMNCCMPRHRPASDGRRATGQALTSTGAAANDPGNWPDFGRR